MKWIKKKYNEICIWYYMRSARKTLKRIDDILLSERIREKQFDPSHADG